MIWSCAWCGMTKQLSRQQTEGPVTHGICEACHERAMSAVASSAAARSAAPVMRLAQE